MDSWFGNVSIVEIRLQPRDAATGGKLRYSTKTLKIYKLFPLLFLAIV